MKKRLMYEVRATCFHTGEPDSPSPYAASMLRRALISRHYTHEAAERAAKCARFEGCTCGCAVVVERQ
jgi:hypothetical protein